MKHIALAVILALSATPGRGAEMLSLSTISRYFNDLITAQAPFSQINDDGSQSSGILYLHRPGRMRFEYDPPEETVVIAGGGAVTIQDRKSNQPPETYPLKRTPLSIILAREVDLERANMVVDHRFDGSLTIVTAQDPDNPEYGSIDLMFADDPIELRQWVIRDGSGGKTTVIMGEWDIGGKLSNLLFSTQSGSAIHDR